MKILWKRLIPLIALTLFLSNTAALAEENLPGSLALNARAGFTRIPQAFVECKAVEGVFVVTNYVKLANNGNSLTGEYCFNAAQALALGLGLTDPGFRTRIFPHSGNENGNGLILTVEIVDFHPPDPVGGGR